ncbi:MAG: hypothetical protein QOF51_4092 [Chloroflexota bacterium]|jgi:uncharacterized protein (TIGR02271 family)|nr:hypothetical protein [Chloroflexota bacterium]
MHAKDDWQSTNEPRPAGSLDATPLHEVRDPDSPRDLALDGRDGTIGHRGTIELREEQLVAHKELRDVGEVRIRTTIEEQPARLEVDAYHEEVEIEHVPVGQVVTERVGPWEENGVLFIPVYEEQLVVVKRLVLREHLKVQRIGATERQIFEDTVRRERLTIEDPSNGGLVREMYPGDEAIRRAADEPSTASGLPPSPEPAGEPPRRERHQARSGEQEGLLGHLVRKALQ